MNSPRSWSESALWIPYETWFSEEIRTLILDAETEWLENAPDTYGTDAGEVWAEDIFPRLLKAQLQDVDIEDIELYLPEFIKKLRAPVSAHSTMWELRALLLRFKSEL